MNQSGEFALAPAVAWPESLIRVTAKLRVTQPTIYQFGSPGVREI